MLGGLIGLLPKEYKRKSVWIAFSILAIRRKTLKYIFHYE